jgi:hypothetical protein
MSIGEARELVADLLTYMQDAETRATVVERLAAEERKRQEYEQLRARFASDEQMRQALGDELADQVGAQLGQQADALRRDRAETWSLDRNAPRLAPRPPRESGPGGASSSRKGALRTRCRIRATVVPALPRGAC